MRVTFNTSYRNASEAVAEAAAEMVTRQRQVATGRRIHVSSDDPAAASAAVGEHAELAATEQYRQAADTVTSRLSVIDTVLSTLIDQTTAAKVAVQSGRGSVSEAQRLAAADNILAIRDSIYAAANTQYRGVYLLSGSDSITAPFSRSGDTISAYQGTSVVNRVDIDRQTSVAVVLDGSEVLQGSDPDDLFTVLADLAAAVRTGDTDAINDGAAALDRAFERFNRTIGRVGTDMTLVDSQRTQLNARRIASQTRVSSLENVDLAEAISAMTQADTAYRAALGAVGTTSRLSLIDYLK
jgi:flagellar hook-associated protein 3 FlgL